MKYFICLYVAFIFAFVDVLVLRVVPYLDWMTLSVSGFILSLSYIIYAFRNHSTENKGLYWTLVSLSILVLLGSIFLFYVMYSLRGVQF